MRTCGPRERVGWDELPAFEKRHPVGMKTSRPAGDAGGFRARNIRALVSQAG